jgi:Cu-Zn family superoxide dismutase
MQRLIAIFATVLALPLAAQTPPAPAAPTAQAQAQLKDGKGQPAGSASFTQSGGMVRMKVNATGLKPGAHGIHIHDVGKCDAPDFKSAGPHFNPHGKHHGIKSEQGAHAGDLPNLVAAADGKASAEVTLAGVTLEKGEKHSLLDANGSALVIHALEDDEKSDPAGNSGDRIACGAIR